MIAIDNVYELEKILRQMTAKQAKLPLNKVLNSLTVRGQDLTKRPCDNKILSIDLSDTMIVFELSADSQNSNNVDYTDEDNDDVVTYAAYSFKLIIYGNSSMQLAQELKARFTTEKVLYDLYRQGVYLEEVSKVTSINEIINDTVWLRSDIELLLTCKLNTSQIDTFDRFDEINKVVDVVISDENNDL